MLLTGEVRQQKTRRLAGGVWLRSLAVTDAPWRIRTDDRLLRRQLLYPAELREHPPILTVDGLHHA